MNTRIGCFSGAGLLATLIIVLVVSGFSLARGGVLFNPGPLNAQAGGQVLGGVRSHAEISRCSACHAAFWERDRLATRCLACHAEIDTQLRDASGLHGVLRKENKTACQRCHTEHHGAFGRLTAGGAMRDYPHEETGFSLAAHRRKTDGSDFACADCHTTGLSRFDPAACTDCHKEMDAAYLLTHTAAFGQGCLACHDGLDTYGRGFDHQKLAFPLQGKHAGVECAACHAGARLVSDLQATPADCAACHAEEDAHAGRFGQNCAICHTPQDWEQAAFDHSLASFPLAGKHAGVSCESCHQEGVYQGTPKDCSSCHAKDDAHNGEFGLDCAGCHTPEGWEGASFDHSLSAFPLTGAHIQVDCQKCHTPGPSGAIFKGAPTDCAACHAEPAFHTGSFAPDCAACHTTSAWTPASFDIAHTFPINHGGVASDCRTCHPDRLQAYTCYGCHEHSPANIEGKHREEGIANFQDCVRCHAGGRKEEGEGDKSIARTLQAMKNDEPPRR